MGARPLLLSIAGVALLLASGCRTITGGACHKPQEYQRAENLPALKMPGGLEGPDTAGALQIPELNEPAAPVDPDGPCLEAPPALTAPPPPPSEVVVPPPPTRRAPAAGTSRPERSEQADESRSDTERERRRTPRRPR